MIPTKEEWIAALEQRHGKALQEKFSAATVAICGLGGLGSNIAIALARVGVGKLILIDFDRVDITNLHRQQYKAEQIGKYKADALTENLREMTPYLDVQPITARITEENFTGLLKDANMICEAFDDAEAKAMLVNMAGIRGKECVSIRGGLTDMGSYNCEPWLKQDNSIISKLTDVPVE